MAGGQGQDRPSAHLSRLRARDASGLSTTMAALPALTSEPGSDELLLLLLRRLPVGQRWTAGERGRWLRAFGGCLDYLVETEAAD